MIVVADASPIIALSRIDRLPLLRQVFGQVVVPEEVWHEIESGPGGEQTLRSNPWIEPRAAQDRAQVDLLATSVDLGEAAAIVLAVETHADVLLMDERRARAVAEQRGLDVLGVVGVLLRSKAVGAIPAIGPVLDELVSHGRFRLAPELIRRARALANE